MKYLRYLFPLGLYLSIFQLEGYESGRFSLWVWRHYWVREVPEKRQLVVTPKVKLILMLSMIQILVVGWLAPILAIVLLTQIYVVLIAARLMLYPGEWMVERYWSLRTKKKTTKMRGLTVIGITGSYGKTTTKEILYQLLKGKYKTLRTPESYNTVRGIAKVVDYELDDTYDYFVCEMAAYRKGDIAKLCWMVRPDYGMITGVTSQHLERFGSLENIVQTKFELQDNVSNESNVVFNLGDENVANEVQRRKIKQLVGYLSASKIRFNQGGSEFEIEYGDRQYHVRTRLFGMANVNNLLGAMSIALRLGLKMEYLIKQALRLEPIQSRSVVKKVGRSAWVDNTFSSNVAAFGQMIETAKRVSGKKALVTPGLVELGNSESKVHELLGRRASGVFDHVVLVGKCERTQSFAAGYRDGVEFIADKRGDYRSKVEQLQKEYDWIFLENDLTQNY